MNILTSLKIYQTQDYDQFKFFDENREIKNNRELEKIIKRNNKLHLHPIIVSPDMEIMDGQHRWKIAKKNNLHLFFVIDESAHVHDIKDMNQARLNWSDKAYVRHFAKRGKGNYIFLKECCEKYKISITLFMRNFIRHRGERMSVTNRLRSGAIELKYPESFIKECLEKYLEVMNLINEYLKTYTLRECHKLEILKCIIHPGYKQEIFLKGIKTKPDLLYTLKDFGTSAPIKDVIISMYNKGHKKKEKFVF